MKPLLAATQYKKALQTQTFLGAGVSLRNKQGYFTFSSPTNIRAIDVEVDTIIGRMTEARDSVQNSLKSFLRLFKQEASFLLPKIRTVTPLVLQQHGSKTFVENQVEWQFSIEATEKELNRIINTAAKKARIQNTVLNFL